MFYRVVANFSGQKSSKYAKLSQLTHLMSMVFFYTLWKRWFFIFSGGIKKLVSWNVLRSVLCVDKF